MDDSEHYQELEGESNPFAMSVGDLMAGLMAIFVLILLLAASQEQMSRRIIDDVTARVDSISMDYSDLKHRLYLDLKNEFEASLDEWTAEIDEATLSIRFRGDSILFLNQQTIVRTRFKRILNDFWPRYIGILLRPEYRDRIEEVRIEGHTSPHWAGERTVEGKYLRNMVLSQGRTRSVLNHVLYLLDGDERVWSMKYVTANGLSSSQPLLGGRSRIAV